MKPTKSQKKSATGSNSSTTINKYFKTAQKESVACAPSDVKSVYVRALLDKLKRFDTGSDQSDKNDSNCENDEAPNCIGKDKSNGLDLCQASDRTGTTKCSACEQWRNKYKEMEKTYLKLSVCYTDLLMKYNDLAIVSNGAVGANIEAKQSDEVSHDLVEATNAGCVNAEAGAAGVSTLAATEGAAGVSSTSKATDTFFTEHEILLLKCMPLDKKKDSTFILKCLQYAYKKNTASLASKTLKGTRARYEVREGDAVLVKPAKDPLTPEKVACIQKLFIDRVKASKCLASEFGERVQQTNFNELVGNAVKNISNKQTPRKELSNQNAGLNL